MVIYLNPQLMPVADKILGGSWSNMILHILKYLYSKFDAFITIWTIPLEYYS